MIIKEFEFLHYKEDTHNKKNCIAKETFELLEKFVLDNEKIAQYLKITTKKYFGKVLQAQNYVGVIQAKDGTTIEILPKIQNSDKDESKEILIKMLKTLRKSPFKNFNMANLKSSKMPLLEIFIAMFLDELGKLVQKGLKSDYISKEENVKFLKGKLKINEQIKKNYIHKERFFVEYQEFSNNRIENKLIKTTLNYLYKKAKSNKNQQRIREFLFVFDEIDISKNVKVDFSKVRLNRQMKDYEQVLMWSKTFLLQNSYSPYKGNDIAFALLFDMNLLFESYVYDYLRRNGEFKDITAQDGTHHLAYLDEKNAKFLLKPDIVINNGKIILDTKWKILSEDKAHQGVSSADMYQLHAYGTKYLDCTNLYLIYPKDNENLKDNSYQFFKQDEAKKLQLDILFFDLKELENNKKLIERIKKSI